MRPLSHFQTHCCGGAMMKLNFFGKITTGTSTLFLHFMLLSVKVNLTIFPPIFLLPFFQFLLSSSQAWQMRVLSNVFWWLIERWWWRKKSLSSLIKINFWKIDFLTTFWIWYQIKWVFLKGLEAIAFIIVIPWLFVDDNA